MEHRYFDSGINFLENRYNNLNLENLIKVCAEEGLYYYGNRGYEYGTETHGSFSREDRGSGNLLVSPTGFVS